MHGSLAMKSKWEETVSRVSPLRPETWQTVPITDHIVGALILYLMSLNHSPDKCPGVTDEIRDRVVRSASTMTQVLEAHGCTHEEGWVSKSAHLTFILVDGPNAHAVDDATVDLGLALLNTATIYPVITFEQAVTGLQQR